MKAKRKILLFLFLLICLIVFLPAVLPFGQDNNLEDNINSIDDNSVIVIMLPGVLWEDLENMRLPNFENIIDKGAAGLMNTTVERPYHPSSGYLTLGSGTRGISDKESGLVYELEENYLNEKVGNVFERHTGYETGEDMDAVLVEYPRLLKENSEQEGRIKPGLLGELLKEHEVERIYHGNADTNEIRRYGGLILADKKGVISRAIINPSKTKKNDAGFPHGYKTDYAKTGDIIEEEIKNSSRFLYLLELGDIIRIKEYSDRLSPGVEEDLKKTVLQNIDDLLGRIYSLQEEKGFRLAMINPAPAPREYYEGYRLTPVVISPAGEGDFLTSSTTKRKGLTANVDFMPTILHEFDIELPLYLMGNKMEIFPESSHSSVEYLRDYNAKYTNLYDIRPPVLRGYIIIQVVIMVMGLLASVFKIRFSVLKSLLLSMLISPLAFVMVPYTSIFSFLGVTLFLILFSIGGGILAKKLILGNINRICVICFSTTIAILIPFLVGPLELIYASPLSHDPISGARFYGLGNELMGVLIGAFTMGLFSLYSIFPTLTKSYYFLGVLLILFFIHPAFGANLGGTLSALAVFLVIVYLLLGGSKKRTICILVVILGAFGAALLYFNLGVNEMSHLGRTIELVMSEGFSSLGPIIARKVSMNLTLLRYSDWSIVFLSFLAVLFLYLVKFTSLMKNLNSNYPLFKIGLKGIVFGGVVAFLVNDSGVITAATMLLYAAVPLLTWGVESSSHY